MGPFTILGRILFVFVFVFSAWREFQGVGIDLQVAVKVFGCLLFICGYYFGPFVLLGQGIFTLVYNQDFDEQKFTQTLGLLGALLFYIGLKNAYDMKKETIKKKMKAVPETKTD